MTRRRILALLLALALLLTGCGTAAPQLTVPQQAADPLEKMGRLAESSSSTAYSQMEYHRPDVDGFLERVRTLAEQAPEESDSQALLEQVWKLYEEYNDFYTMMNLADIRYCGDLSDQEAQTEYEYCTGRSVELDQALEELYQALAQSPARGEMEEAYFGTGFFVDYDGGAGLMTETQAALLQEESALVSEFYAIMGKYTQEDGLSDDDFYIRCNRELGELYIRMIRVRRNLAREMGLEPDQYEQLASGWYYGRTYDQDRVDEYLQAVRTELVPLYIRSLEEDGGGAEPALSVGKAMDYVAGAAEAMGGTPEKAADRLSRCGTYDIAPGRNKFAGSFEVYLVSYGEGFVFMNPTGGASDALTLAHEFGHYTEDYAKNGSGSVTDVAEFFSQAMEYLSLCYAPESELTRQLQTYKLGDSLAVYVEQSAYYSFEHQAYRLPEEELTVEGLNGLYAQVCRDYGFTAWDESDMAWVTVSHFFTNPLYVLSYTLSNDAAFQLYALEQAQPGRGLALYEQALTLEQDQNLEAFVRSAGLEDPCSAARVRAVARLFENMNSNS